MEILKYRPEYEIDVVAAISREPDWSIFINEEAIEFYRRALESGITYVCYSNDEFCGYVRALLDEGFAVYVSELYVLPEWRNRNIGQSLLERVKVDHPGLTVYALSDEDDYYLKKGYKKAGSVFAL